MRAAILDLDIFSTRHALNISKLLEKKNVSPTIAYTSNPNSYHSHFLPHYYTKITTNYLLTAKSVGHF